MNHRSHATLPPLSMSRVGPLAAALAASAALAAGCGSPSRTIAAPDRAPPPDAAAQLDALGWIAGDWLGEDERTAEHWVRAPGVIWGVALSDVGFEVLRIEPGDDGALRLVPAPNGQRSVVFTHAPTGNPSSATFTNPDHDDPTSITYEHHSGAGPDPEALRATLDGPGGPRPFTLTAISDAPAAPPEVLTALAAPTGAATRSWRSLPEGDLAATLTISGDASHVAVWKRGADGAWTRAHEDRRP